MRMKRVYLELNRRIQARGLPARLAAGPHFPSTKEALCPI